MGSPQATSTSRKYFKSRAVKTQRRSSQAPSAVSPKSKKSQRLKPPHSTDSHSHHDGQRVIKLGLLGTVLGLLGGLGLTAWLGGMLLFDPHSAVWINRFLPDSLELPIPNADEGKSLSQIKRELYSQGLQMQEMITVGEDLIVPIAKFGPNSGGIIRLDVYVNQGNKIYSRLDYVNLPNFYEDPILRNLASDGSHQGLKYHSIKTMERAPKVGYWFNAIGDLEWQDQTVNYGQIGYFDPTKKTIKFVQSWHSLAGELPQWENLVKETSPPELLVNQSLGYTTQWQMYQLNQTDSLFRGWSAPGKIALEPISLDYFHLSNRDYETALGWAKIGMWQYSLNQLQRVKANAPSWNVGAEAQLQIIALNAKFAEQPCKETWYNSKETILSCALNNKFDDAITELKSTINAGKTSTLTNLKAMITGDGYSLLDRVKVGLSLEPHNPYLQLWGAMTIGLQENPAAAIAWLDQYKPVPSTNEELKVILDAMIEVN